MNRRKWALMLVLGLSSFGSPELVAQADQSTSPVPPKITGVQRPKHDGGKDDLEAIGNRKIGGRGFGNWYSLSSEIHMGKEYSKTIELGMNLLQDPVVTEYVNRIGQKLVRNSDAKVPFIIKVVDSDEINAFALPGGFLYVNSGLILAAQDEAELAGVMAHEIAHIAARHATRQMTRANIINLASISLIFVGGGVGYAMQDAAVFAVPLSMTKFSCSFEAEADYLGVEYLYKTGYDPQAFISFFERVKTKEKSKPGIMAKAFSTHPQTADRIRKSQLEIARILPARELYVVSTSDFDDIRARLTALENRHRINGQNHVEPSLRHRTGSPADPDSNSKKDNDRPTLKRRDHSCVDCG